MKRREFIKLSGAITVWPLSARAQQPTLPVIGMLSSSPATIFDSLVAAFRQGLKEAGYVEGRNVALKILWAEGAYEMLPALAAELVRQQVNVIVTTGGHLPVKAAMAATSTIPIVFLSGDDPIQFGLVASLSRPGGNVTGLTMISSMLGSKQLSLMHDLTPNALKFGALVNPNNTNASAFTRSLETAARALDIRLETVFAGTQSELDAAFDTLVAQKVEALIVGNDTFLRGRTDQLVNLSARRALPVIYPFREFVTAGGLMSYGASLTQQVHETGAVTAKILGGAKPAELPVQQPTQFEFVINLKTAKALGLGIPPGILAIADEVIE